MKRLLAISWWFPPLLGPRSIQVARNLSSLAENGWHVDVLTTGLANLPLGVSTDSWLLERYCEKLGVHRFSSPISMRPRQLLSKLVPSFQSLPDPQVHWANKAKKESGKFLLDKQYSAMISYGQPWSSHLLALDIKKRSGLPWLAYFSDPWSDSPYLSGLSSSNMDSIRRMEGQVVTEADKLAFSNQPTLELLMKKYGRAERKKGLVIPHSFDVTATDARAAVPFSPQKGKLLIVHSGNIYGIRSPEAIFQALIELSLESQIVNDLEMVFVGSVSKVAKWKAICRERGLQDVVRFVGQVSYRDSLAAAEMADVLMVLDAPSETSSVFLPSKLVEYLPLNKVIFGITPSKGVSADLLNSLDMPVADPGNPKEIAGQIAELHKKWKSGNLKFDHQRSKIAMSYSMKSTGGMLEKALLGMIEKQ